MRHNQQDTAPDIIAEEEPEYSVAHKIILYGNPFCGQVTPIRNLLERSGAEYEYIDISFSKQGREQLIEINQGYASVPTLIFPDGSKLTEPTPSQLAEKLVAMGYEIPAPTGRDWLQVLLEHSLTRFSALAFLIVGWINQIPLLIVVGLVILLSGFLVGRIK